MALFEHGVQGALFWFDHSGMVFVYVFCLDFFDLDSLFTFYNCSVWLGLGAVAAAAIR